MSKDKSRFFPDHECIPEPPDVAHLEDWAVRLGSWLEGKRPPTPHHASFFRPDIGAEKALMRLEEKYPAMVRQIVKMVDFCEADLRAFERGQGHVNDIGETMNELWFTLNNAVDAIKNKPKADGKADGKKNLVPDNPDVARLAKRINKELSKGGKKLDIARDFTGGNEKKAQSLLRKLRDYPHLLTAPKKRTKSGRQV